MDHVEICLLIAIILFVVVAVMRLMNRAFDAALIAIGLAVFALAFLVNP